MRCFVITSASVLALLAAAPVASGQTATFEMIPIARGANDLSPDGRFLVGEADWNGDGFADGTYLRDFVLNTVIDLENSVDPSTGVPVTAVSDNGATVLGNIPDPEDPNGSVGNVAGIWRAATGEWTSLGYLANALSCPSRSDGYELSADGSVAVGLSWDGCSGRAIRWTEQNGMVELQVLANGSNRASVVSADGTVIGGFAQGNQSRTPAVWTASGAGELLDPTGDAIGEIHGMSDDGTILLGEWLTTESVTRATKWTGVPGAWVREQIGAGSRLPGWSGIPTDIADDGTIVGFDILIGNRRAWIQPQGTGPILDLKTYIQSLGGTVPAGMTLEVCQAISRDGRCIVGHGFGSGAWRVVIHRCPADLSGDGTVGLEDLTLMLGAFGSCTGDAIFLAAADFDADGCIALGDLALMLSAFGTICN